MAALGSNTDASGTLQLDEPVMILTCARSGSTLLRMFIDAHPDLGCPPETNLAKLCAQWRELWLTLDTDSTHEAMSDASAVSIREMVETLFGAYLERRNKRRWCDKSLDAAEVAPYFLELYSKAKFICLYRHAMDVINSGLEASPFGLRGYGFDAYARASSTNSVAALAGYWLESTMRTLAFEEKNADRCLRVHYEELVSKPDEIANRIFDFIGVARVPDIAKTALADQDRPDNFGPGDHKVRGLDEVTEESVGRGIRVPVALLSPSERQLINSVLGKLGYTPIDDNWSNSTYPPTLLALPASDDAPEEGRMPEPAAGDTADDHPCGASFDAVDAEITRRAQVTLNSGQSYGLSERFAIIAYTTAAPRVAQAWVIDPRAGKVESGMGAELDGLDVDFCVTGDVNVWRGLFDNVDSISNYLRQSHLRTLAKPTANADGQESSVHERDIWARRTIYVTQILRLRKSIDRTAPATISTPAASQELPAP